MSRTLVVYHSRTGHTRRVAKRLARRLGADVEEVRLARPVGGPIGYALCALEAIAGITPALQPSHRDAASYDAIVIGTPVWFWGPSSPVHSWLAKQDLRHKRVAFFCTMGGSGAGRAFSALAALSRTEPLATMALAESDIESGYEARLDAFVRAFKSRTAARARPDRHAARPAHVRT